MKFTCDSCGAQYMISDDKVGPNGVKVRCKKCQNVVLVRKAAEPSPVPAAAHAHAGPSAANGAAEGGLDAELGHAFDSMLGGAPAPAAPPPEPDPEPTQLMSKEDAAKIGGAAKTNGVAGPATDWYVAIADSQVGPLPLSDVKRKWEAGEIGPDSLVWRPGMGDWAALTTVGELASALAPVPQPSRARAASSERSSASRVSAAPAAPREEPTWKPAGASALAALASEEIASRGAEAKPAAAAPRNAAKSLVEQMNLPDAGGVDPTGAIPLPIKGMEPSPSPQLKRRTSVARGAAEVRHRRSMARGVVTGAVVAIVLAGGVVGGLWYTGRLRAFGEPSAPVASTAAPSAAAPAPAAPAPAAAPAQRPAQQPVAAAPAPQPAAHPPVAAAAPVPERRVEPPPPAPKPEPVRVARADPAPRPARTERRVSRPEPVREPVREQARAPEPEPPAPAPAPARKKDSLLDFEGSGGSGGSDHALEEALGGTPSGRSVYVPPRPGSDLPDHLSASQINESVLTQVDSLRRCVSEQKARDAEASGTLKMRWIIGGDGGVRDVKCLTPEYASGPFAQCISGVVKTIRFPRSTTKGQEVTFPFTF